MVTLPEGDFSRLLDEGAESLLPASGPAKLTTQTDVAVGLGAGVPVSAFTSRYRVDVGQVRGVFPDGDPLRGPGEPDPLSRTPELRR
ncbi:hypothetical protein GCM10017607_17580 [Microbacterium thalassium]|nr:hypothetical protein GCM10017607_17580 [Microbacterium thalassium]